MAQNEDYSIKFGSQQLLIENPVGSTIFEARCGITTLGKSVTTNTADVDLPPCNNPDALIWLGVDPVSKRLTVTFSGTVAKHDMPAWREWSMAEDTEDAFREVRWYIDLQTPNQGYWEGRGLLTEFAENSENRGRWTFSGTIVFDGRPVWHSIPPAPGVTTAVSIPTTAPEVGTAFAATAGTYTGTPTLSYQWFANHVEIDGATSLSYTPVAADEGKTLYVVETAENDSGSINSRSADSLAVQAAP